MTTAVDAKLNDNELKVLDLIRLAGWEGKTCDEVEIETGLTHQGASARVSELWHKHDLIEPRGARRKTRNGGSAAIYVLKGTKNAALRSKK